MSAGQDGGAAPKPVCEKCEGSGEYAVRITFPMSYVGPGPVPDDARGIAAIRCQCFAARSARP